MADLTGLSNEELIALAGGGSSTVDTSVSIPTNDFSGMSDAQLIELAGGGIKSAPKVNSLAYEPSNSFEAGAMALSDAIQPIARGVTFGLSDDISSGANAWIDYLSGNADSLGGAYTARQKQYDEQFNKVRQEHPVASIGGEIIGAVKSPLSTVKLVQEANALNKIGKLGNVARTTANQGLLGSIYGFGAGEEGKKLQSTLLGGAIGAGGNVVLEAGTGAISKLAQTETAMNALNKLSGKTGAVGKLPNKSQAILTPEELMLMKSVKNVDDATLLKGLSTLEESQQLKSPLLLQEAVDTPELYQQAKSLGNTTAGRDTIQTALNARSDATPDRLNSIYDLISPERDVLTATQTARDAAEKIVSAQDKARSAVVNPLFEKAFQKAPLDTEQMANLFQNPIVAKEAKRATDLLSIEHPNLPITDSRTVQKVLSNIGGKIQEAKRSGDTELARDYTTIKKAFETELETVNPDLLLARKAYADISKQGFNGIDRDQLLVIKDLGDEKISEAGAKIFKLQPEQIVKLKSNFKDNPEAFDGLVRSHLQNLLETTKDGQNALKNVMNSTKGRAQMEAAIGSDKFAQFKKLIEFEQKIKEGERAVKNVSATAGIIDTTAKNEEALNLISQAFSGGWNLTKNIAARIMNGIKTPNEEMLKATAQLYADPQAGYNALKNVMAKRGQIQKHQKKVGDLAELFSGGAKKAAPSAIGIGTKTVNTPTSTTTISVNNETLPASSAIDKKLSAVIGTGGAGLLGLSSEAQEPQTATPPTILAAVKKVESNDGDPRYMLSNKGAIGPYQIMPDTGNTLVKRRFGVDLKGKELKKVLMDDAIAKLLADDLLQENYQRFGNWDEAIAAYNAGAPAVAKYGGIPPFKETKDYVKKVNMALNKLTGDTYNG